MNNEAGYSGWSNQATWLVNLWFSNEEPSYRYWTEQAEAVVRETFEDWEPEYEWETHEGEATRRLADGMQEEIEEIVEERLAESGLLVDLMRTALGEVDWLEVAQSWLEEIEKPEGWLRESDSEVEEEEAKNGSL